ERRHHLSLQGLEFPRLCLPRVSADIQLLPEREDPVQSVVQTGRWTRGRSIERITHFTSLELETRGRTRSELYCFSCSVHAHLSSLPVFRLMRSGRGGAVSLRPDRVWRLTGVTTPAHGQSTTHLVRTRPFFRAPAVDCGLRRHLARRVLW